MRLSIIVPAFNEEAYILDCLYYILEEIRLCSCPSEVEVLVVDNVRCFMLMLQANPRAHARVRTPHKSLVCYASANQNNQPPVP